jgi:hypothetical protein
MGQTCTLYPKRGVFTIADTTQRRKKVKQHVNNRSTTHYHNIFSKFIIDIAIFQTFWIIDSLAGGPFSFGVLFISCRDLCLRHNGTVTATVLLVKHGRRRRCEKAPCICMLKGDSLAARPNGLSCITANHPVVSSVTVPFFVSETRHFLITRDCGFEQMRMKIFLCINMFQTNNAIARNGPTQFTSLVIGSLFYEPQ